METWMKASQKGHVLQGFAGEPILLRTAEFWELKKSSKTSQCQVSFFGSYTFGRWHQPHFDGRWTHALAGKGRKILSSRWISTGLCCTNSCICNHMSIFIHHIPVELSFEFSCCVTSSTLLLLLLKLIVLDHRRTKLHLIGFIICTVPVRLYSMTSASQWLILTLLNLQKELQPGISSVPHDLVWSPGEQSAEFPGVVAAKKWLGLRKHSESTAFPWFEFYWTPENQQVTPQKRRLDDCFPFRIQKLFRAK